MGIIRLLLLSFALGIDCFIVSFSQGMVIHSKRTINSLLIAAIMGLFQGLMPIIGYFETSKIYNDIQAVGNIIAFVVFLCLGVHVIISGIKSKEPEPAQCIGFKCLLLMGFATSIDALFSGISLMLTKTNLLLACSMIGAGSFIMAMAGFWGGNILKNIHHKFFHFLGGLILILLAVRSVL